MADGENPWKWRDEFLYLTARLGAESLPPETSVDDAVKAVFEHVLWLEWRAIEEVFYAQLKSLALRALRRNSLPSLEKTIQEALDAARLAYRLDQERQDRENRKEPRP